MMQYVDIEFMKSQKPIWTRNNVLKFYISWKLHTAVPEIFFYGNNLQIWKSALESLQCLAIVVLSVFENWYIERGFVDG